jgi:uroporphyrinogen decarboxylase
MNSNERVRAAIAGAAVDRPPVSVWRHFPEQDQTADDLARVTVDWQKAWGWDFVKFMPPGDYATIDWGAETKFTGASGGNRTTTKPAIAKVEDWESLEPHSVTAGFNGMVLDALRKARAELDPEVPFLQTIFSPLTIAQKMTDGQIVDQLRSHPATIHAALKVITEVTKAMVAASYEAGADGIFFASQLTTEDVMTEAEYRVFGVPYDFDVIAASRLARQDGIVFFHTHGDKPMLKLAAEYAVDILNWHDRLTGPPLRDGYEIVGKAVAGGINEQTILDDSLEEVAAEASDAIASMDGRHVLVTPGCVIRYATPEDRIRAVADAVRGAGSPA